MDNQGHQRCFDNLGSFLETTYNAYLETEILSDYRHVKERRYHIKLAPCIQIIAYSILFCTMNLIKVELMSYLLKTVTFLCLCITNTDDIGKYVGKSHMKENSIITKL